MYAYNLVIAKWTVISIVFFFRFDMLLLMNKRGLWVQTGRSMKNVNTGRIQVTLHNRTFVLKTERSNCLSLFILSKQTWYMKRFWFPLRYKAVKDENTENNENKELQQNFKDLIGFVFIITIQCTTGRGSKFLKLFWKLVNKMSDEVDWTDFSATYGHCYYSEARQNRR